LSSRPLRGAAVVALIVAAAVSGWLTFGRSWRRQPSARVAGVRTSRIREKRRAPAIASFPAARALGLPPVPAGPVPGYLLIADRNNNRLLVVSPDKRVVWRFPRPGDIRPGESFRDPDDAFFTPGYRAISINEEFNQQVAEISLRTRRIVWSYGRAGVAGSGPEELSNPDDAYALPSGQVMVADIQNCRVIRLNHRGRVVGEIGRAGRCVHDPPRTLLAPNGATPLSDGGVLVTEIGGYIDRIDARGRLLWSIRSPTSYPSDAQLLPNGNVLVAGFNTPGRVDILRPDGRVVWTYAPSSGPGALDRPSLAVRWPNGLIAVTDDWHHRVIVLDPQTKRIVWEYGHNGLASAASGYLSKPDGLDLLPAPSLRTAQRPQPSRTSTRLTVRLVGKLPAATSRAAAVALPDGRVLVAGGLIGGSSSDQILLGPPERLRLAGRLPAATHDAAAAPLRDRIGVFGGGEAVSTNAVSSVDPQTGAARAAGRLDEPLSDLAALSTGGRTYLVGGYTGARFASAVLRLGPRTTTTTVARLPTGLRYAGVTALDGTIYIAGGVTTAGPSSAIYAVDPVAGTVRRFGTLPQSVSHAPLLALRGALYLVGGVGRSGAPLRQVLRIDPRSGTATAAALLPVAMHDASAVTLPRRGIVIGGGTDAVYELLLHG
jgi:hypothetical protein